VSEIRKLISRWHRDELGAQGSAAEMLESEASRAVLVLRRLHAGQHAAGIGQAGGRSLGLLCRKGCPFAPGVGFEAGAAGGVAPASLTRGKINDFHRPGKISQETELRGWGTWIRTKINGVRVRCSTVELSPTRSPPIRFWTI
jgi:hypothetical protein